MTQCSLNFCSNSLLMCNLYARYVECGVGFDDKWSPFCNGNIPGQNFQIREGFVSPHAEFGCLFPVRYLKALYRAARIWVGRLLVHYGEINSA